MKFRGIFRFELACQGRRVWPWLIFAVVLVLSFLVARDTSLEDALYQEFFANSPFAIAKTTVFGGLFWLLTAAFVAGEAAARDVATGMHPLTWTAPIRKADYLGGRFLAALVVNALLLLAVQIGIVLAVYSPGIDPKVIGPFRPAAFLTAYAFIALPNAFVATALQFSLALRTGRAMAAYLGSVFLVFMGFFVGTFVNFFVKRGLGTLLDPIGIQFVVEDLAHLWTTAEKNTRLLAMEGALLTNRLLWVGLALGTLALTYWRFRFEHRVARPLFRRRSRSVVADPPLSDAATPPPRSETRRTFDVSTRVRQTLAIGGASFRAIAKSWAGLALLIAIPLLTVLVVVDQMVSLGTPLVPTTARVLRELTGGLTAEMAAEPSRWVIIPLLLIFFAGELVWREREAGVSELTDATPVPEWVPFLGKYLGLGLVLVAFLAAQTAAGMLAQVMLDYHHFEIGLYLKVLFGLQLPEYLLFAMLALVAHVVVNQKYVGHLAAILAYAFTAVLASVLGIEHNLLVYGAGPAWSYTQMRGFGGSFGPWLWFKLYWAAWALLLAVVARLLWVRGREEGAGVRIQLARRRLTGPTARVTGAAAVLILTLGGFIFYNTNILNAYLSTAEVEQRRAEYERRYRRYENVPQPVLTGTKLRIEIYPRRRAAQIRGSYALVNRGSAAIDSIHVAIPRSAVETRAVTFDRRAKLALDDTKHGHRIYALERPLGPGDTLRLDFEVQVEPRGFGNRGASRSVVANGSYFTNAAWFPAVGYQRTRELLSASDRREHGLPPRPLLESLYDEEGREVATRGGGIAFEAVMGTDDDQIAVAPGALRRSWTERGRRYFHYATSAPIGSEWAFFSARYAVHEGRWKDVAIRIFHHPEHTAHLRLVMRSVQASLDYHSEQYGPYPYRHLTIIERGGAPGSSMHADPSMISHGEHFSFWRPRDEERSFDMPYAVVAHEMGHQWTLPYALVEGLPFLSEGLAWYTAMGVVQESRGEEQLHRLLTFMRQPYPHRPIRRGEPLLRAMDPYMSYRRGPFAMWALRDYAGADRVNGALRRLIEKHEQPGAPRVTTLDLHRELEAATPPELHYLLHDLFEVNTFWQFETGRATAVATPEGSWRVTLDVTARKVVYDEAGAERVVPMDELVPIGVFAPAEPGHTELSAPLHLQKHRIRSGKQTITLTVPRKPVFAGIDPHHLLDWEEEGDDDNVAVVEVEERR
ncbi:MAG TPA: hypothetical protein VF111_02105 [Thermoanaerobaculia bacterium]